MRPAISVIVPVHNAADYLPQCLDSILKQTFTDIEVITVNDGSTDDSGSICEDYAGKDSRVRVIHQPDSGVSAARNKGLEAAKGRFIGFVDADDYIEASMYEKLYKACLKTDSDIAVCNLARNEVNSAGSAGERYTIKEMLPEEALRELFKGRLYRFSLCNKLFSRRCFDGIHFPEKRIHEDLATTYRLFSNSGKCIYCSFTGYIYVKRQNSILTSRFNQDRLDAFTAWKEILNFMEGNYTQLLPEVYACFGYWAVDNVYYTLDQTESGIRGTYLKQIAQHIRPYYKKLMGNRILSLKYKTLVSIIYCNANILQLPTRFKRMMRAA